MKSYSVSLAFIEWETQQIMAVSAEDALEKARELCENGEWDGHLSNRERVENNDEVFEA